MRGLSDSKSLRSKTLPRGSMALSLFTPAKKLVERWYRGTLRQQKFRRCQKKDEEDGEGEKWS